jgi:RimJ/RimL family protein N-acetyltransferase
MLAPNQRQLAHASRPGRIGVMDPDAVIVSSRVDLCLLDAARLAAFIERRFEDAAELLDAELEPQWPDVHDAAFLATRLSDKARHDGWWQWGPRAVVARSPTRRMIGHAGFHGPPGVNALGLAGAVELGYTVFPAWRCMGHATEVARALMNWARREEGVTEFVASVAPTNAESLAVVRKLGFVFVREVVDDVDGPEHVHLLRI